MENKKIKNATRINYNNIVFKSKLEKSFYETLLQYGFNPQYEHNTFVLWEGFKPTIPYYNTETTNQKIKRLKEGIDKTPSKILVQKTEKIISIKYTPDFYFKYKNINVYIEGKSIENDVFYIKKKLFIKYLNDLYLNTGEISMYFEVYTKKQLLQVINILQNYEE